MASVLEAHPLDAEQPQALRGAELERVRHLAASPRGVKFYQSAAWRRVRAAVLAQAHGECLRCRERGRYARAEMVHHVFRLDKHPELALAASYMSGGKPYAQLVPLCSACHEEAHFWRRAACAPLTPERW